MTIPRPPPAPSHSIAPLRQRPAWSALKEQYAKVHSLHLRQLFTEDLQRGERFTLEESSHQRDDKTAPGARRAVRPTPAHRCHVRWQQDQRHRAAGGWIWAPLGATSTASLHRARSGRSIHSISGASSSARPWPGALSQSLDQRSHSYRSFKRGTA